MRNIDLYNIRTAINKMSDIVNIADINFTMTIARINDDVEKEIKLIDKGRKKPTDKYKEFLEKQNTINMKYAIQKEDGTLQTVNGSVLVRNPLKYNTEIKELKEEYKEEVALQEKLDTEFEEYLDQEFKGNITKLPKSLLPASVNVEQVKLLFSVIQ